MNLLLLRENQRVDNDLYQVHGRQALHVREVLGLGVGDCVRAGLLNGPVGRAEIMDIPADDSLQVRFLAESAPPAALPLKLVLALPRPKMLKRVLIDATSLGIKDMVLLNSWKVDKSYWQTPELKSVLLEEKLQLGLEQAGDTAWPSIRLEKRFKPFVEDELDAFAGNSRRLLAHPRDAEPAPMDLTEPVTLVIGPEGGWTEYEVTAFRDQGFEAVAFGQRILRVETALPTLVGRLMRLV